MAAIQILDLYPPPYRYPDLWVVLNVLLSFGVFSGLWLWSLSRLVKEAWGIGGLRGLGTVQASHGRDKSKVSRKKVE
jgi:hypothetical protein